MGATASAAIAFEGFGPGAFAFFKALARNNNREWFQPRKEAFERECLAPFKALTVALDPPHGASRITRIYRDVRLSKDKSPYQLHVSGIVGDTFLQISAEGLYVGTGLYMPDAAVLRAMREAIATEASGAELARLVKALRAKGYTVQSHESLASVPRGCSADHPVPRAAAHEGPARRPRPRARGARHRCQGAGGGAARDGRRGADQGVAERPPPRGCGGLPLEAGRKGGRGAIRRRCRCPAAAAAHAAR
jgi:uncharacterized protein (TIGR02453 family)